MRPHLLRSLVKRDSPANDSRRSLADFHEQRHLYVEAWDRVDRYPDHSTREELESIERDATFLLTCFVCSRCPVAGHTKWPSDALLVPICKACLGPDGEPEEKAA